MQHKLKTMKKISFLLLLMVFSLSYSFGQNDISGPIVQMPVYFDVSPPLRDMVKHPPPKAETSWKDGIVKNRFNIFPQPKELTPGGVNDPSLQTMMGMTASDTTIMNFDGNTNTEGYSPPDTHGDVGLNHYFQVVNCHYSIYNKTGTRLLGPLANSSVFSGLPNNSNDGDAVVLYDEQADRWLFSQFSMPGYPAGPFFQMIAISTSPDPTGTWYRYQYQFTNMPDYPKFAVWPDGYYMTMHQFTPTAGNFAGSGAVAYNRTLMLAGSPAATMIMFTKSSSDEAFGWLPSDCDGPFPTGNPPNYYVYAKHASSNDHLGMYEFHVDWTTTANSTFGNYLSIPVNSFTNSLSGVAQKGTTVTLDVLNDRMMYRLQYRTFADHAAMVCNHTVDVAGTSTVAGIRWYELRKSTGAWSIYQMGTYAPADNNSRWMGSIAMDSIGNMALGYSVSGSNLYPSIRYTGRKKDDALGQMTLTEKGIYNGGGYQSSTGKRWGDYSAMNCDPSAKATFWYTQMYYATTSSTSWKTRIASFSYAVPPLVTTLAATNISVATATINGSVTPNNLATNYHFEWGTSVSYGNNTSTLSAGSGNSAVAVNAALTGLISGTTYHCRVAATNNDGTSYGNDISFTPGAAIVTTTAASSVTSNSAISGGNVVSDGGLPVTVRGVCWALIPNPTISGNHTSDGTGTGSYASTITGLLSVSLYHVRAYATNASGTVYGDDVTFTTTCGAISSFPWNEGFEGGDLIPSCWSQEQVNSSGLNWSFLTGNGGSNPATAHGGVYNACLVDLNATDNITRLITPRLNLALVTTPQLKFWHTQEVWNGNQDVLEVYYKTSLGGTWTLLASYTASVAAWTQRTISLPNVSGDYYIAFQGNAKYGHGICIDDVQVSSSCARTSTVTNTIAASSNTVCLGTGVTFTATPTYGGTAPAYQWNVNGSLVPGATNATYAYVPVNNDFVTCTVTSNATCVTNNPATSNSITITVNPILPVSVSIVPSATQVCAGTSVTCTATPSNGGTTPLYQWKVNGNIVAGATNATYAFIPSDGNSVTCLMTSGATCTTGNPATSNTVTMTVNPLLPASVAIDASANPVCAGTSVTCTATPSNGGTAPAYQWKVNGTNIAGATNATYAFIPSDGNSVTCQLTSSETCSTGNPATSNTVAMTVSPLLPVGISIAPSANPVVAGTAVTFTATGVNGGISPAYQWNVNGTNISGETNSTYSYTPANNDAILCTLTSDAVCITGNPANSNTVNMVVNPLVPVTQEVQNLTVTNAQCFNAVQTIIVAGGGNFFTVEAGGSAKMIAGQNILYYPGTVVNAGGYMWGYIVNSDGPWCATSPTIAVTAGTGDPHQVTEKTNYRIYPNPTTGAFILEFKSSGKTDNYLVEIYDMKGLRISSDELRGEQKHEFSLSQNPVGLYFVKIVADNYVETIKLIRTR